LRKAWLRETHQEKQSASESLFHRNILHGFYAFLGFDLEETNKKAPPAAALDPCLLLLIEGVIPNGYCLCAHTPFQTELICR
jgi:hypothetical protein